MPFDGRNYGDARYVHPYAYHPNAPDTGVCMSGALRQAYLHARHHRGLCFAQPTAWDMRTPQTTRNNNPIVSSTSYQSVGGGYSVLPDSVTHVVGFAIFKITEARDVIIHARVVVVSGVNTDTGADTPESGPAAADLSQAIGTTIRGIRENSYSPYAQRSNVITAIREVQLSAVAVPATALVKVQVYLESKQSGAAVAFWPYLFGAWWECRD